MSMPFAVLLLRSVYEAADSMDFIAMVRPLLHIWSTIPVFQHLSQGDHTQQLSAASPMTAWTAY